MGYRDYSTAKGLIVDASGHGDFTTISSAITAASSGQTIFIRPGTYTENPTLKAGVNLSAFGSDGIASGQGNAITPNVIILGTCDITFAGSISLFGIQFKTNGASAITNSGSNACVVIFTNCSFYALNATGIAVTGTFTNWTFFDCVFNATSTFAIFSCVGNWDVENAVFAADASAAASTISTGNVLLLSCDTVGLTISANNGTVTAVGSSFEGGGLTFLTTATGQVSTITNCKISSGNVAAISIGSGSSVIVTNTLINCVAANWATGAGTLLASNVSLNNTTSNNVTTANLIASYGSITFDGTNILSNYATGTFVPTLNGSTPGTTTYSLQTGYYTRIGNMVYVQGYVTLSASTGTGLVTLGALPFTIKNQTNEFPMGSILWQGGASWVWPTGATSLNVVGVVNTTTAILWASGSAVTGGFLSMANAALTVAYSLVYQI